MTLSEDELRARIASVPFWYHRFELAPGITTPGIDSSAQNLARMNLPSDLSGKRVLDIGACDGFYSFECERRGAEVVAIEGNPGPTGFNVMRELLGSRVECHTMNIYDLTPEVFGEFDLVLCLGVLYHLRHPLLGLERVHAVCRGRMILETQVCDHHFIDASGTPRELAEFAPALLPVPLAQFYPAAELNHDTTNWWSPNLVGLLAMLRSVGFEPYQTIPNGQRAYVHSARIAPPVLEEWADTAHLVEPQPPTTAANGAEAAPVTIAIDLQAVPTAPGQQPSHAEQVLTKQLAEALAAQSQLNLQLQQTLALRDAQIADLEARSRWLEGQSSDARRALAAVENGRALRILRWLSRG
jgi:tRNA (mo5U34)-methyltransferase